MFGLRVKESRQQGVAVMGKAGLGLGFVVTITRRSVVRSV